MSKAIPYDIYDIVNDNGCVNIGVNHDTAEFAVNSIRVWWNEMGCQKFPHAKRLLITADSGGSNDYNLRLWKRELQELANEFNLNITVCHFPSGTSKWNKIEHRLFSFINKNWRGRPLCYMATVVNLISNTTTEKGLTIKCVVDEKKYDEGITVSKTELNSYNIKLHDFHSEWNYTIKKQKIKQREMDALFAHNPLAIFFETQGIASLLNGLVFLINRFIRPIVFI